MLKHQNLREFIDKLSSHLKLLSARDSVVWGHRTGDQKIISNIWDANNRKEGAHIYFASKGSFRAVAIVIHATKEWQSYYDEAVPEDYKLRDKYHAWFELSEIKEVRHAEVSMNLLDISTGEEFNLKGGDLQFAIEKEPYLF